MTDISNKIVEADFSNPGTPLNESYFDQWRERNGWPSNKYRQKEEYGIHTNKKTVIDFPGMGSNDRGHNQGAGIGLGRDENESNNKSLSSGYNDGEQADDETGPGNSPSGKNEYFMSSWGNELFTDLEMKGSTNKDKIEKNLKDLLGKPGVEPTRRYRVDRF